MNGEIIARRASSWEIDLILKEAEKFGTLVHNFFAIVEGKYRDVYAVNNEVWKIIEDLTVRPFALGTFVGMIKVDENLVEKFYPAIEFFTFVDIEKNYAVLGPKASFLFTTGKDVPKKAVRKLVWKGSKKIVVMNELGDVLGIGRINPSNEEKFIKNITDVGAFLRK
ncbi:hypothetical protein PFDSM3638_09760 [Pyrococcus furiosus DSM 3638]|uniref:Uncharacterized protein n=3 Tax=Pyrococcus furiosus TaxID=2261 RepID=Q8TZP7_PYRFU|nr:hypothetical protein [Pyrococcus furiosus]AAL82064.1 hypothetical protein PF1940 [Pyrococcus furiosus DSM 3638]AFN04700.1 hypothetical protein PFC_08885 [Pyrococcus furiosus COM1]QEK79534.1 hypothetical protein PFDSM3638_09760 [Pyrococcus furiosus DSM 3638]